MKVWSLLLLWLWLSHLPELVYCRGNQKNNKRKSLSSSYSASNPSAAKIREDVQQFQDSGQYVDLVRYLEDIIEKQGNLVIDNQLPSLYNIYGVALHSLQKVADAEVAFQQCVEYNPKDSRCWINLGEARMHQFKLIEGMLAVYEAWKLGDVNSASRLLRAKGWTNSWQSWEEIVAAVKSFTLGCSPEGASKGLQCLMEGTSGLTYINVPYWVHREAAKRLPGTHVSNLVVDEDILAPYWKYAPTPFNSNEPREWEGKRLKVGLVSSDFGVHPVATLLRGMIQFINTSRIELYCFSLNEKLSWWGTNISKIAEHFVSLSNMNTQEIATEIASRGVEILIDLNGHTLHSGLEVMAHRPAPVQVSFLGFPTSTGAQYIDYYMGDPSALPAEGRDAFTEKIAYMPPSCIANDYAQLRGEVLELTGSHRLDRSLLRPREDLNKYKFLFTTLSNFQKITPSIFHVWMNILQSVPGSSMVMIEYQGYEPAIVNLKSTSRVFGIDPTRLVLSPQAPWIDHLPTKTAIDMILDTPSKNGHTTGLDGLWVGIPTVTLGGGIHMEQRAGESFAEALDSFTGIAFSLKEYEDIAIEFARSERNIRIWREHIQRKRVTETLYDTRHWTQTTEKLFQAIWEAAHLSKYRKTERFHVLTLPKKGPPKLLNAIQVKDDGNTENPSLLPPEPTARYLNQSPQPEKSKYSRSSSQSRVSVGQSPREKIRSSRQEPTQVYKSLPMNFFEENDPLLLNIGGYIKKKGWVNVNSQKSSFGSSDEADIIRELQNLQGFPNNSVAVIYCSHTLEHVSFGDGTLEMALKEWHRVLKPDGMLLLAVPDMQILARLILDPSLTVNERFFVIKMIYGAQSDTWDYHMSGFDESILRAFLTMNSFCEIERVGNFNLFSDTSAMKYKNYPISLNMAARKCKSEDEEPLGIDHVADKYEPYDGSPSPSLLEEVDN